MLAIVPESDPRPGLPTATPQVVPRTDALPVPVHSVMSPNPLSWRPVSVRFSSNPPVFATSTLYLTVTQAWVLATQPLVIVAELGASVDVTVTVLESVGAKVTVLTRSEWPYTVTLSVTDASSPSTAVKSQVPT